MENLSPEERAARAAANEAEAKEALRLAGEARQRDLASGQKPLVAELADSVLAKLKEKFPADKAEGYDQGAGEGDAAGNHPVPPNQAGVITPDQQRPGQAW